jgi:PD-(D/E)XK nuclease superfamily
MTIVTVIRASSLSGWADCPRRGASRMLWAEIQQAGYRLRYTPRGIASIVGTSTHRAAAFMLDDKARSGTLPSRECAVEAGRDALSQETETSDIQFDGPNGATHTMADAVTQVVRMTTAYHQVVAPKVQPIVSVETRYECEVEPGIILSGAPDIVAREPDRIRDLKTGARPPASFSAQLGAYSLIVRSHGLPIDHAAIDFIRRVKPKNPQPDPVTIEAEIAHAENAAASVLKHIVGDLRTFREGDPERRIQPGDSWAFLANPSSSLCSAKYCPAHSTDFCHEWKQHG